MPIPKEPGGKRSLSSSWTPSSSPWMPPVLQGQYVSLLDTTLFTNNYYHSSTAREGKIKDLMADCDLKKNTPDKSIVVV